MTAKMFVYGTLMSDAITRALLGRRVDRKPAVLNGFKRFHVKDEAYPAIVRWENSTVSGMVLLDLKEDELMVLDVYEESDYKRIQVEVHMEEEDGTICPIQTQVYAFPEWSNDLEGEWNYDQFCECHLDEYVQLCSELRMEIQSGQ